MPYLQINDKQIQLRVGETRIGVGAQVEVRLPAPAAAGGSGVLAIIELGHASHGAIRRAGPDAVVRVNGLQLGAEPTPLIHGDKIEVGGSELFYGDDRKGGSTQFIAASNVPDYGRLRPAPAVRATAATGGRVISLVDGREYTVTAVGLVFGRDAGCDVVVPSTEVSRRHAEIVAGDSGYVVTDTSTNGVFVNGVRVEGIQILGRGDILRIGGEEFRFYADVLPSAAGTPASVRQEGAGGYSAAPAPAQAAVASTPPNTAPASAPRVAVPAATAAAFAEIESAPGRQLPDEPSPPPVPSSVPRPASRGAIASLNVIGGGVLRGEQYGITTVLAHVGRGEHNDVIIPEESVSDSHAKLQRRDGVWYVVDLGSTNGTYVAGRRIDAEEVLGQTGELRLGGVKLLFNAIGSEPTTGPRDATREFSGAMASDAVRRASLPAPAPGEAAGADARGMAGRAPRSPRPARPQVTSAPAAEASWVWWLIAAVIVGGLGSMIYFLFVKSH